MGLSGPFADAADALTLSDDGAATATLDAPASATPADAAPVVPAHDPTPVVPPASATPAPTDAEKAQRARDEKGKFVKADGTPIAASPPAPSAASADPTPPVEREAAPAPTAYVAAGQTAPLYEGALRHPVSGDVLIPASQVDALERDAMRGRRYEQYREDRKEAVVKLERTEARHAMETEILDKVIFQHFKSDESLAALVEAINTYGVASVRREISQNIKEGHILLRDKFGADAMPVQRTESAPVEALDQDEAQDTLNDYIKDQLALPEFKGMPRDMEQKVRDALRVLPLYVHTADGWHLNERHDAAVRVWEMAKYAMQGGTKTATASQFNQKETAKGGVSATPAPPSVSAARSPVGNGATRGTTPRDPLIDPKTGKKYDDPWQAILRA